MTETEQEIGRRGLWRVKQALEQTMRFNIAYTAYDLPARTSLLTLSGDKKMFDLLGNHLSPGLDVRCPVYVEAKNEKSGSRKADFTEFLAVAYSATKKWTDDHNVDPEIDFMFAMICPWAGGTSYYECASTQNILDAVAGEAGSSSKVIPEDHVVDEDLARRLSERLWVWVIPRRQEEMSLSKTMQSWISEGRQKSQSEFAA